MKSSKLIWVLVVLGIGGAVRGEEQYTVTNLGGWDRSRSLRSHTDSMSVVRLWGSLPRRAFLWDNGLIVDLDATGDEY